MTPPTIRYEAIFVTKRIARPNKIAMVDVSPIDPGTNPKKALLHV